MQGERKFYLIDDDPVGLGLMERLLTEAGHQVRTASDSDMAMAEIAEMRPDCVITDIMMPGVDGFEICQRLRDRYGDSGIRIVVVSGKSYEFDQRRARDAGADGYLVKPVIAETFLDKLERILTAAIRLEFWGVRGTLPVSGPETLRYGGSTSCVSLTFSDDSLFIFDAGSGIRNLGNKLLKTGGRHQGKIFISHPHWDHINAFPFFGPLFVQGNHFDVMGPAHSDRPMKDLIGAQMEDVYFPITMREFGASITFRDLREEKFAENKTQIATMLLSHPGSCLGYRITNEGRSICYITDNELFLPDHPQHNRAYRDRLVEFVGDADLLITDTTYTDEGYLSKIGWGHSCVSEVVRLAHDAGVKELALFHHDPDDSDDDIDKKLQFAQERLAELSSSVLVSAPAEGDGRTI